MPGALGRPADELTGLHPVAFLHARVDVAVAEVPDADVSAYARLGRLVDDAALDREDAMRPAGGRARLRSVVPDRDVDSRVVDRAQLRVGPWVEERAADRMLLMLGRHRPAAEVVVVALLERGHLCFLTRRVAACLGVDDGVLVEVSGTRPCGASRHDLGGELAPGAERPAPRASLPLSAKLQGQAMSLGLTLQPLGAIMGQLSKYVVMHHRVSSSLSSSVARVGPYKVRTGSLLTNEPSFPGRITDAEVPKPAIRACGITTLFSAYLSEAGVCGAGSLRREGERPADADDRCVYHTDLLSRLEPGEYARRRSK